MLSPKAKNRVLEICGAGVTVTLLDDQQLRHDVGVAGQAYVLASHRWDQCLVPLMSFLHLGDASVGRDVPSVQGAGGVR